MKTDKNKIETRKPKLNIPIVSENIFPFTEKQINMIYVVIKHQENTSIKITKTRLIQMLKDEYECQLYSR